MYTVTLTTAEGTQHTYKDIREISFTDEHRRSHTTYKTNTPKPPKHEDLPTYISAVD